jgi:hypothetical protein
LLSSAGRPNDYGTILSRIDILRAVAPAELLSTVPHVRAGGESLGGRKVLAIRAVEARNRGATAPALGPGPPVTTIGMVCGCR